MSFISLHLKNEFSNFMPPAELERHLRDVNIVIISIVFLSLILLYILLMSVISRAAKTLVDQNKKLMQKNNEIESAYSKLSTAYRETLVTLSKAVDARDSYTAGHSERVSEISSLIARRLDLPIREIEQIKLAATFHDIGKIGIPDSVLLKPGKLTEIEYKQIKEHSMIGVNILSEIVFLKDTLPIILHHHENYDGTGYPIGISGTAIPIGARVIRVADTFDAMTSNRPYRKALSHEEAIQEIQKFKGSQFDPEIADTIRDALGNYTSMQKAEKR